MGVALTSCTPPAKGKPIFELGDDEMEVGVGIHGEPGRRRDKIKPADAIVDELFDAVAKDLPFKSGDRVAMMVNGFGGTPPSELYVLYRKAALRAKAGGLNIVRNYVGNYCTSLEMAGASLTLLKLDKEIEELLGSAGRDRRSRVLSERKVKLLAIDLDGTLVDSAPDIAHCLGRALEAIGYAPPGEARTRVWIGDGLETLIARAIAHGGTQGESTLAGDARHKAALAAFLACYADNLFVRSRLYPGVLETLDALQAARRQALLHHEQALRVLATSCSCEAGIRERFELLLGGDSLAEKKPSPLPLKVAAETLGVAPSAATLVGDSHQDLRAARAAGYGFVLASYGYGKIDETELGSVAAHPHLRRAARRPRAAS